MRRGLAAGLLAAGIACAPHAPLPSLDEARRAPFADVEREVAERVNRHRIALGLAPLASDPAVAQVARRHSLAMARGATGFGHAGLRARLATLSQRMSISHIAENVSRHTRARSQVARYAVAGWLESRGHRRNIEAAHQITGVGAAREPGGPLYLTQIFVAR